MFMDPALFATLGHRELRVECAIVIAIGTVIGLAALIALQLLPTGVNASEELVFRYGFSKYSWLYRMYATGFGIASIAAAIAVHQAVEFKPNATGWFTVFALSQLLDGWLPRDEPGKTDNYSTRARGIIILTRNYYYFFALFFTTKIANTTNSRPVVNYAHDLTFVLIIGALFLFGMTIRDGLSNYRGTNWFGLMERVVLLLAMPSILLITAFAISR